MHYTALRRHKRQVKAFRIAAWILLTLLLIAAFLGHYRRVEAQTLMLSPEGDAPMFFLEFVYEPTPTPTATPTQTPIPTHHPFPVNEVSKLVEAKAKEHGISVTLFKAIAMCESGFRPEARAGTSSATGVFQFIKSTWLGYVKKRGLDWTLEDRTNAEKNVDMAAYVIAGGGLHNWKSDPRSYACWGWAEFI